MSTLPTQTIDEILRPHVEKLGITWAIRYELISAIGINIFCRREEHCHVVQIPIEGIGELLDMFLPHAVLELGRLALAERVDPILAHAWIFTGSTTPTEAARQEFEKRNGWLALTTAHVGMWTADLAQEHTPDMVSRQVRATLSAIGTLSPQLLSATLNNRLLWRDIAVDIARVFRFQWHDRFPDIATLLGKDDSGMLEKFARLLAFTPRLSADKVRTLRMHEQKTQALCKAFGAPFAPTLLKRPEGWHDWDTGAF